MTRIIDLSMPIEDHFRWPVERRVNGSHAKGDVFEVTLIPLRYRIGAVAAV